MAPQAVILVTAFAIIIIVGLKKIADIVILLHKTIKYQTPLQAWEELRQWENRRNNRIQS